MSDGPWRGSPRTQCCDGTVLFDNSDVNDSLDVGMGNTLVVGTWDTIAPRTIPAPAELVGPGAILSMWWYLSGQNGDGQLWLRLEELSSRGPISTPSFQYTRRWLIGSSQSVVGNTILAAPIDIVHRLRLRGFRLSLEAVGSGTELRAIGSAVLRGS